MGAPHVLMQVCNASGRTDENTRARPQHKVGEELEPIETIFGLRKFGPQLFMLHEQRIIVSEVIRIRVKIVDQDLVDIFSERHLLGECWLIAPVLITCGEDSVLTKTSSEALEGP